MYSLFIAHEKESFDFYNFLLIERQEFWSFASALERWKAYSVPEPIGGIFAAFTDLAGHCVRSVSDTSLISRLALTRGSGALHNGWIRTIPKICPKNMQVIPHGSRLVQPALYHDCVFNEINAFRVRNHVTQPRARHFDAWTFQRFLLA